MKRLVYFLITIPYSILCGYLGVDCAYDCPLAYSWFMYHYGGTAWRYPFLICVFLVLVLLVLIANKKKRLLFTCILAPICFGFALNAAVIHNYMGSAKYNEHGFLILYDELYNSSGNRIWIHQKKHYFSFKEYEFKDNCIIVRGKDYKRKDTVFVGLLDAEGKELLEFDYKCDTFAHWKGYVLIHNENGYGLLNPQSEVIYTPNWYNIYEFNTSSGKTYLQLIRQENEGSWKRGLGDFNGQEIIPAIYSRIQPAPCKDLCIVEKVTNNKGVFSILDKKQIIPCEFRFLWFLNDYILAHRRSWFTNEYLVFNYDGREMTVCSSKEQVKEWLSYHHAYTPSTFDDYNY